MPPRLRLSARAHRRSAVPGAGGYAAARFLSRAAWDRAWPTMPFEIDPAALSLFLRLRHRRARPALGVARHAAEAEFLDTRRCHRAQSWSRDFAAPDGGFHPVLALPDKHPPGTRTRCAGRGLPGCYQLKAAHGVVGPAEATGEARLPQALRARAGVCPWQPAPASCPAIRSAPKRDGSPARVSLFPGRSAAARRANRAAAARFPRASAAWPALLGEIAPEFERSDVYAQLLRMRLLCRPGRRGAAGPRRRAMRSVERLEEFQVADDGQPRAAASVSGASRRAGCPIVNPVSTAFALQALALWDGCRTGKAACGTCGSGLKPGIQSLLAHGRARGRRPCAPAAPACRAGEPRAARAGHLRGHPLAQRPRAARSATARHRRGNWQRSRPQKSSWWITAPTTAPPQWLAAAWPQRAGRGFRRAALLRPRRQPRHRARPLFARLPAQQRHAARAGLLRPRWWARSSGFPVCFAPRRRSASRRASAARRPARR